MKNRYKDWEIYRFKKTILENNPDFLDIYQTYNYVLEILENEKTRENIDKKREIWNSLARIMEENNRNILSFSWYKEIKIGSWKDSSVFEVKNNPLYVYKESFRWNLENFIYLRQKYLLLKKYLWDLIPKSYLIFWESYKWKLEWLRDWLEEKIFTIQKKIDWKDLSKISFEEKKDKIFLEKLEKAHKKYILLKIFLEEKSKQIWFDKKTMDIQLDLWDLSEKDSFSSVDLNFVKNWLKSPNIMWDWKNIYFIDFWAWTWDNEKQDIYKFMTSEETLAEWENILKLYNLN